MKKLTIARRDFYYEVRDYECGEYDMFTNYETIFYTYKGKGKRKKYWLFGPEIEYPIYEEIFTLHINIESPKYTKEIVKEKLYEQITLLERQEQIDKGEII